MKNSQFDAVMKEVLKSTSIASSSDLIVSLYQICVKLDDERALVIDPIYRWEYNNYHDGWESNVNFIGAKLVDLDELDYIEVETSYSGIIELFLNNEILSKIYRLDENDVLGWKILKELREKRELVKKHAIIARYKRERNEETNAKA